MSDQIHCPQCGSNQITANKKGFSGRKAVAGAVLTGGIGLLAGTLGKNKIIITCLACGHTFGPGEGRISSAPANENLVQADSSNQDQIILDIYRRQGSLNAVKYYKDQTGADLMTAKNYVDRLTASNRTIGKGKTKVASKTEFKIARVLSIIVSIILGLMTLSMMVAYFGLEKSEAKNGMGVGLLVLIALTLLFIYIAKKSKHPNV